MANRYGWGAAICGFDDWKKTDFSGFSSTTMAMKPEEREAVRAYFRKKQQEAVDGIEEILNNLKRELKEP